MEQKVLCWLVRLIVIEHWAEASNALKCKYRLLIWPSTITCKPSSAQNNISHQKSLYKAAITVSLDLCPHAYPHFVGPWNGNALRHSHPKVFIHFIKNVKWKSPRLNSELSTIMHTTIRGHFCDMWNENEACLTIPSMKSGDRSQLKVELPL